MKTSIRELAALGGTPAFSVPLHTGRPFIGKRERLLERINGALDRRWLTNDGPLVREFGEALREICGARHVIPVANGTVALEMVIRALELRGEVIVPSFTFVATAHALQWHGVTPVFCDIDPRTHTIDADAIEALITPATTAILGVHLWGRPCAIRDIQEIANRHGLRVVFDAAHALNVSCEGRPIGTFGDAEIFSFHATKFINSLEGGAVATNDDELAARIRLMINFGFAGYDDVRALGVNGKLNEFSAAMGLTTLESLDHILSVNARNYDGYRSTLAGIPGITMMEYDSSTTPNFQYVVAELDEAAFGIHRDCVLNLLQAENVLARRYFYPGCHRMEPYRSGAGRQGDLTRTEELCERIICLPCGSEITPGQIDSVGNLIRMMSDGSRELRELYAKGALEAVRGPTSGPVPGGG